MIADDEAEALWRARDRAADGRFVVCVATTGIYCRPSCPARQPLRRNVRFMADGAAARAAGFRACLRCRPDALGRDEAAVAAVRAHLDAGGPAGLDGLAAMTGYSPAHLQRLFKRDVGTSPAGYARERRAAAAARALAREGSVTEAIYAAGYEAPSRFYAEAGRRLGMTPSAWRDGGRGVTIRYALAETPLGRMLLAATEKGICRLSFDEGAEALAARFPHALIEEGGAGMQSLVEGAVAAVGDPGRPHGLPLDVEGTAFQRRVWAALSAIPPGETLSYAALAAQAGNEGAVRAAGSACGANQVAVLIPCHRAVRSDGTLGGYAYGLARKRALLAKERG